MRLLHTIPGLYRHAPLSADSVSMDSVIRDLSWPPKKLKIKEINGE
jgi:hypothetical protein